MLILKKSDIESLLTIHDVIEVIEEAFRELAEGTAVSPMRTGIFLSKHSGWMAVMPAYLEKMGSVTTKVVTHFDNNWDRKLPTVMAVVILNSIETGDPLAVMEGTALTNIRTGATGGVAIKYMARKDSKTIGLFGCGAQSRTQLMAACNIRNIERALIYDKSKQSSTAFSNEMSAILNIPVKICDPEHLVKESDIIITATTSINPVFNGEWINPGTHLNVVGSFKPDAREVDDMTIQRSIIVVEQKIAALKEAGDIIIPLKNGTITETSIYAEMSEIVAGIKTGRTSDCEITLFKSTGLGIQDCAAAWLAYTRAKESGMYEEVNLRS